MNDNKKYTDSDIEIKQLYTAADIDKLKEEIPGKCPFTRGIQTDLYRGKMDHAAVCRFLHC